MDFEHKVFWGFVVAGLILAATVFWQGMKRDNPSPRRVAFIILFFVVLGVGACEFASRIPT